jgi:hypothetical protein
MEVSRIKNENKKKKKKKKKKKTRKFRFLGEARRTNLTKASIP